MLHPSLRRLRWMRTMAFAGSEQHDMTVRAVDPASGAAVVVRTLGCNHLDDAEFVRGEAVEVRDVVHPHVLRVVDVHSHELRRFSQTGALYESWHLVLMTAQFCPGGLLQVSRRESRERASTL